MNEVPQPLQFLLLLFLSDVVGEIEYMKGTTEIPDCAVEEITTLDFRHLLLYHFDLPLGKTVHFNLPCAANCRWGLMTQPTFRWTEYWDGVSGLRQVSDHLIQHLDLSLYITELGDQLPLTNGELANLCVDGPGSIVRIGPNVASDLSLADCRTIDESGVHGRFLSYFRTTPGNSRLPTS